MWNLGQLIPLDILNKFPLKISVSANKIFQVSSSMSSCHLTVSLLIFRPSGTKTENSVKKLLNYLKLYQSSCAWPLRVTYSVRDFSHHCLGVIQWLIQLPLLWLFERARINEFCWSPGNKCLAAEVTCDVTTEPERALVSFAQVI